MMELGENLRVVFFGNDLCKQVVSKTKKSFKQFFNSISQKIMSLDDKCRFIFDASDYQ